MQLEKIRAMAAELKPTRGRSRGAGKSVRPGVSRGASKSRGRGHNETLGDDCSDMLGLDDPTETEQTTSSSTGLNRLWDPDCEDDTNDELNGSSGMKKVPATSDYRMDVADESEEERDELAVMDSLLALYDPEASKDLGITDLKVELDRYYQIHVDTEQVRDLVRLDEGFHHELKSVKQPLKNQLGVLDSCFVSLVWDSSSVCTHHRGSNL
ncbi:unnamed protein product [Trichobilharzia regenti]|nr:unnamed protein product [Trichobilharzia regenti]